MELADFADPDVQEYLACSAYYREKAEGAALDREHTMAEATYVCLAWESLSDDARRPYRATVAMCSELVARALV